ERQRVHVDRDRPVALRALQRDPHEPVGALLDALLCDRWPQDVAQQRLASLRDAAALGPVAARGRRRRGLDGGLKSSLDDGCGGYLTVANPSGVWTKRYDADGTVLWAKVYSALADSAGAYDVAKDAVGNGFLVGWYKKQIKFGGQFALPDAGDFGGQFAVELDPEGNHVWSNGAVGGPAAGHRAAVDAAGNLLVLGQCGGAIGFSGVLGGVSCNNEDVFLTKFGPTGNFVWSTDGRLGDADRRRRRLARRLRHRLLGDREGAQPGSRRRSGLIAPTERPRRPVDRPLRPHERAEENLHRIVEALPAALLLGARRHELALPGVAATARTHLA
ncbi:MAG: hypothetical protein IT374_24535, partial [Polyangiaceae bacterium]|nr:hypothetical protein [Polyangiaceae bacterium]